MYSTKENNDKMHLKKEGIMMLKNSKKIMAIALAALFLSTPLMSTASAAAPDFAAPMQLELRSNHHSGPSHSKAPSHSVRPSNGHKSHSHSVRPAPRPQPVYHHNRNNHVNHRQPPPPPPRRDKHHHSSGSSVACSSALLSVQSSLITAKIDFPNSPFPLLKMPLLAQLPRAFLHIKRPLYI